MLPRTKVKVPSVTVYENDMEIVVTTGTIGEEKLIFSS